MVFPDKVFSPARKTLFTSWEDKDLPHTASERIQKPPADGLVDLLPTVNDWSSPELIELTP